MTFDLTSSEPLSVNSATSSTIPLTFDPTLWDCLLPSIDDEAPPTSPLKAPPFVNDAPSRPPSVLADILRVCRLDRITEFVITLGESFIMLKMAGVSSFSPDGMLPSRLGTWLDGGRLLSLGGREVGEGTESGICSSESLSFSSGEA